MSPFSWGSEKKVEKQEKKPAKQERKGAKREKELGKLLAEIIFNEASKLHPERGDFYRDLVQDEADAQGLVRALMKELEKLLHDYWGLARDVTHSKAGISEGRVGKDYRTTQEYEKEIRDLKWEHSEKIQEFENRIRGLAGNVSRLEGVNDAQRWDLQRAHEREQRSLQDHNTEKIVLQKALNAEKEALQRLQEKHNADEERLCFRISELQKEHKSEKAQMQQDHKSEKDQMQQKHKSEIYRMQQEHKSEKDQMQLDYESEIYRMQNEHKSKKDQMQLDYESEIYRMQNEHKSNQARLHDNMMKMKQEHESNQARLHDNMTKMKQDHDSEQKQMRKEVDEEKARLKSEFEAKKAQLEMAHAAETKRLRRDIEAYSDDLLTRDDFKPMLDNEMKVRFLDLAQEIDTLARLDWKPNQKEWTNQVLQRLSRNQRLLKKQLLQDSVWLILHENIFCSPFRVFGEEGRRLESQWNDKYEQDSRLDNGCYIWPKPSIDAERWRYATIKECRAALEKPVSEWDPWARLKKGFKTSLNALTQELTSTLGEVSNLDENNVQAVGSIIKKAAKMWLEFGMQRCRVLVIVQGSNLKSAEERIQRAQEATLKLVLAPELKRFGNSKGQDVHIEETVGGCNGEMVEVSVMR